MKFEETELAGSFIVSPERLADERGHFARTWCRDEFAAHGLTASWVQGNISFNRRAGTLRGMHYQAEPRPEIKLVRCTRGAVYDVIVDLRRESPTYRRWTAVELSADNGVALYVPAGFAHGFQTLLDDTELVYEMSEYYVPELARGVRWNDPVVGISWPPCAERIISQRDRTLPGLES